MHRDCDVRLEGGLPRVAVGDEPKDSVAFFEGLVELVVDVQTRGGGGEAGAEPEGDDCTCEGGAEVEGEGGDGEIACGAVEVERGGAGPGYFDEGFVWVGGVGGGLEEGWGRKGGGEDDGGVGFGGCHCGSGRVLMVGGWWK